MSEFAKKVRRFHQEHGPECYQDDDGLIYYADGAWREGGPMGVLAPPLIPDTAEKEFLLAQNVLKFYELKLEHAIAAFREFKETIRFRQSDDQLEQLLELKRRKGVVDAARPLVAKARRGLERTRWGSAQRASREAEADRQHKWQEWQHEVDAIRI